jgi:hypothetical protein
MSKFFTLLFLGWLLLLLRLAAPTPTNRYQRPGHPATLPLPVSRALVPDLGRRTINQPLGRLTQQPTVAATTSGYYAASQ